MFLFLLNMRYVPCEMVAWALAQELDMDDSHLGDCEIDTIKNEITYWGAVCAETKQLPESLEIILHQHGDRVTLKNTPKHKSIDYFFQRRFAHYVPKDES